MPTRNVNLTDHYDQFIEASISTGRFSNASEAVRAGLHLLELQNKQDEAKLDWQRNAAREAFAAFDRGEGIPLDSPDAINALVQGAREKVRAAKLTHA